MATDLQLKDSWVWEEVACENRRQINKWGVQSHNIAEWHLIIAEEFGELSKEMLAEHFEGDSYNPSDRIALRSRLENEAIQLATLAMKIAEMAHSSKLDTIAKRYIEIPESEG